MTAIKEKEKIKVLLIEDSGLMRIIISDLLRRDNDIEVVGTAKNGKDGVLKALALQPDVIITDMIMPEYDGHFVTREIMSKNPIPILVLSSLRKTDHQIFDVLDEGAIDFIDKPRKQDLTNPEGYTQLIDLVKKSAALDLRNLKHTRLRNKNSHKHTFKQVNYEIVVIGASTGGPRAIESIIKNLPENLPVPVVIAQHMPEGFIAQFVKRLAYPVSPLQVKLAENEEPLEPGVIYFAPGTSNVRITHNFNGPAFFKYTTDQFKEFNHPSIDCLFTSAAHEYQNKCLGIIMTGMGRDGTQGAKAIKNYGGYVIAQDEQSSVVFGMSKNAILEHAVDRVVSLKALPGFLITCLS